jgi:transcriptional regulator with XRE-family HTH domain
MSLAEVLLERIQRLVDERGITVNGLLKECGVNRNLVSDLKSRGSLPSADKLDRIAAYFDVSVDYLLGRTEVRRPADIAAASATVPYEDLPPEALEELERYKELLRLKYGKKE